MKILQILFVTLFLMAQAYAQCESERHHIFLLHGIGGSKRTFGSLETLLNRKNPCISAQSFEYETGSHLLPKDFAWHFHQFMTNKRNIRETDKISLIMHSQGGLVGSQWLKLLVDQDHSFLKQIDSFITLSTPLWGTDIAHIGKRIFYTLPDGIRNPLSPFGKNELNEMTYGSTDIQNLMNHFEKTLEEVPHIRPLFIAGMKRIYNSRFGEDDIVVPMHSMQPSHYSLRDEFSLTDKNRSPASFFEKSPEKPFIIVPADHIKIDQHGVADIPSSCLKNENCSHPSLRPILNHLEGKHVDQLRDYSLTRFRGTLYVNNPELIPYDLQKLSIKVKSPDGNVTIPAIERMNPFLGTAAREKGLAFSFGGIAKKEGVQKLKVSLEYKGTTLKTYEVPVEGGFSTFIEATLK